MANSFKITNVKFSCSVSPPIEHSFFNSAHSVLQYWGGSSRYIIRCENYVYCFMSNGSFVNITGSKKITGYLEALETLKTQLSPLKFTFSKIKTDAISAVVKLPKRIFPSILRNKDFQRCINLKTYHSIPGRINVRFVSPSNHTPNMSANVFSTGSICIFGARSKDDIRFFIENILSCL